MALARPKKIRIGDLLVEHKVITADQLQAALARQKQSGHKLGRVLIESGMLNENQFLGFLARQLNIDYIDLRDYDIKVETVQLIPEVQARRFRVIALEQDGDSLLLGMADPTDIFAYDEITRLTGKPLRLAVVRESDLLKTFDTIYRRTTEISGFAQELGQQLSANEDNLFARELNAGSSDAPVVRLLQTVFEDAIHVNASDIHIEPDEKELRIRFRIDGVLRVQTVADAKIAGALLSRLKLMATLDISEKRLPQDGRFNLRIQDMDIDVRLSTLPTQHGESAVMRLLNLSAGIVPLDRLGMPDPMLKRFLRAAHSPNGILLVVGPTGSGKTTTLYSILSELNTPGVKIITVEDPVEYRLPGITQVQINTKIDLSFARVLRSILRQDPDIALIGEMRDQETMEIGLRAAMTGHFVLSTLHTNDAVSTAMRMADMGAEPYLIAAALRAILAQRLVRRVCTDCAEEDKIDSSRSALLSRAFGGEVPDIKFRRGAGCAYCNETGYQGRVGIYELLEMDEPLVKALHQGDLLEFSRSARAQPGFQTLKESALELAKQGITSLEEVIRVCYGLED